MGKKMMNRKTRKEDGQRGQTAAPEKNNTLLISAKLLIDLKNKGITAFRQMTDDEQKRVWKWSREVIRKYHHVLETDPSNIRAMEDLPFPKEDIKLAIKLLLPFYISKDVQSMVKMLKTAYKEMGAFQTIDPQDKKPVSSAAAKKGKAAAEQYQNALRSYDKYMELVVSEKKGLLQEIDNFISGLQALK
jgi:hypothetical protein